MDPTSLSAIQVLWPSYFGILDMIRSLHRGVSKLTKLRFGARHPIPMSLRARAESVDSQPFDLSAHTGKCLLVFYEDKDVRSQNQALKDRLWKSMDQRQHKDSLLIVAVADVSAFNWWPAKKVVTAAIREESRKLGSTIWCDWDGSFGRAMGATKGASNVMLVGRDGAILFKHSGALPVDEIDRVLAMLPD
jgi:hypothetical protein